VEGEDELPGKINYFTVNDLTTGVLTSYLSQSALQADPHYPIYPGVDLIYYGNRHWSLNTILS